ncbi:type VII secretion-associated protein [Mycolicibacterium gadium]|jgi:type VII secretion-associated protein (TIGR03931 family)|uniref:Type VII secretion-associated protein n=1 Tax=Mycolicibacterium gadium TaxID=1794 RepID=A0A7I7WL32_MYCGU|nr:type VII secretion-associated protein [Mycolicibacterium gadium]MDG5481548.1 type VII secretion-associated protein [Mycolicibacterium gadium]BBZ18366.1 type VII secretion-associated protein [Mycolicibacterium gadium]
MSEVLIEVGPATIRGPNDVSPEWVSVALHMVDDELALLDDRPVPVRDVWEDVMRAVTGAGVDTAVVVCPAWWSPTRIDTVRRAAHMVAAEIVMVERIAMLREGIPAETTIVEITGDVVVVTVADSIVAVVPRQESAADADAVAAAVAAPAGVLVDAPASVPGADVLASLIARRMRTIGVPVRIADDGWVLRAAKEHRSPQPATAVRVRERKALAVLFGTLSTVVLCGGLAAIHDEEPQSEAVPMTLLVEGRVGVMVPTAWTARRITSGPGSARVQVVSPTEPEIALQITQSVAPLSSSLADTADSLHAAFAEAPDGAFVDFNPSARRADRDAVTYREVRSDRHVAWTVLVEGATRIAIGCQSAPGREHLVKQACEGAIRSAHAVSRE